MACEAVNRTAEEVHNLLKNKNFIFDVSPSTTFEETVGMLEFLKNNVEKKDEVYWFAKKEISRRVSQDFSKASFEDRHGKVRAKEMETSPDNIKRRDAGIRIHEVMASLVDFLYNGKGTEQGITDHARKLGIEQKNFLNLVRLARKTIADVEEVQARINKEKGTDHKAYISVEQFIVDPVNDRGGTADILVLFSDKSGGLIDYKTSHANRHNYVKGRFTDDLLGMTKVADYELNMNEYRRMFEETVGIKKWRMNRLIPIHVQLRPKSRDPYGDTGTRYDYFTDSIETINTIENLASDALKPVPLQSDLSYYKGINNLLVKQWGLLDKLVARSNKKGINKVERDNLNQQIIAIRKTIQKTIIDADISDILTSAKSIIAAINNRINEEEFLDDGVTPNDKYMSDNELMDAIDELGVYEDVIADTAVYYEDMATKNPELHRKLKEGLPVLAANISRINSMAKIVSEERIMKYIGNEFKDADGNLLPLEEVGFMVRNFTRFSNIDHPVFATAWAFIQRALYEVRTAIKRMNKEVTSVEKEVFKWAKANNMSKLDAFKLLVDEKTGNLVYEVSEELLNKIEDAYENPDKEAAYKRIKEILEIKDEKKFREFFEKRLNSFKEKRAAYFGNTSSVKYKEDVELFIAKYDLVSSPEAWLNEDNRKYLSIKEKVKEANWTPAYKRIAANKPLLDYYTMYKKYNDQFRKLLGIDDYRRLPPNFVANIRKTMVDYLSADKLNIIGVGTEFFDSLKIREDDKIMGDLDASGNIKRTIPILFMNAFRDKDGNIDNSSKSFDLSKNLLLFGKMAHNFHHMNMIEPKLLMLKAMMGEPSSETPGTLIKDKYGRKIKGRLQEFATKKGIDTSTYKLYEDLIDAVLYGIRFKDSNISGGMIDSTKVLLKLKQYFGKSTLGLAIIPAAGAKIVGTIMKVLEGSKGMHFTRAQMRLANKQAIGDPKKYVAITEYFDVYAQDLESVLAEKRSANWFSRNMTYRNLMAPLRITDELITQSVLNAMIHNYGIDIEGKLGKKNALVRLNRPGLDTTGIKPMAELLKYDKETGEVSYEGETVENHIAFRNAVKETTGKIFGSLSPEDISNMDTNLFFNIAMQFKTWAPDLVRERFGKLTYDDKTQSARWGRYKAALAEWGIVGQDFEDGKLLYQYMSRVFMPQLKNFALDLLTFGFGFKSGLVGEKYTDASGETRRVRTNIERAKRMFIKFKNENPHLHSMTFDEFLEIKEGQMRSMFNEIRAVVAMYWLIGFMGGAGDDGEPPRYMNNWTSRFIYKNITKAQEELTFAWNIDELSRMIRNPVPMTGLLTRGMKTMSNFFDESRDLLMGEDNINDQTPFGYYLIQWFYGGNQLARFFEFHKIHQKSPYMTKNTM